jgi:DNA polymerase III subunit epsilon
VLFSSPPWDQVTYWALDLETGGLDPRRDAILAVAVVPVRDGHVRLGEAYRTLVRPEPGARVEPRSVEVHQLVSGETRDAPPLAEVLPEVLGRIARGVLLVHHARLDVGFLKEAARVKGLRWPAPPVVDTVELLLRFGRREQRAHPELPGDPPPVNLAAARCRLGLPEYPTHEPLADAIATAELFLLLRDRLGARRLRDLR